MDSCCKMMIIMVQIGGILNMQTSPFIISPFPIKAPTQHIEIGVRKTIYKLIALSNRRARVESPELHFLQSNIAIVQRIEQPSIQI